MSNYGDTPDETPKDPYAQQPPQGPPGAPDYGQPAGTPDYGQPPAGAPYGQPYGQGGGQPPSGQPPVPGGSPFSIGDAFGYGWRKFQANLGPILIAALVLFGAIILIQIIQYVAVGGSTTFEIDESGQLESDSGGMLGGSIIASLFFGLLTNLAVVIVQSGIVKGALDVTRGKPVSLGSMFSGYDFVQVVIAAVILAIATTIGFVLCILPGFVVLFLTAFTLYFIIDKGLGAIDAIKASVSFVMANAGTLIVFFLACLATYLVGALLCLVGLLVAIPVVVIAQAYAYRTLNGEQVAA